MRSLPEHSVDCWTAIAVREVFPRASIWAPTQNNVNNWDMALSGLGPYKALLFENKGCEFRPAVGRRAADHTIAIDVRQLRMWAGRLGLPVFYVLPSPPWQAGPPMGDVPLIAQCALPTNTGAPCPGCGAGHRRGFADWAYVTRADRLMRVVARSSARVTFTREASDLVRQCRAIPMTRFLAELRACEHVPLTERGKRQAWDADDRGQRPDVAPQTDRKSGSGLLAAYLPF